MTVSAVRSLFDLTATGCVYTLELSKADLNSLQMALMKPTNGDYEISFLDEDGQQAASADAAPAMNASQLPMLLDKK